MGLLMQFSSDGREVISYHDGGIQVITFLGNRLF